MRRADSTYVLLDLMIFSKNFIIKSVKTIKRASKLFFYRFNIFPELIVARINIKMKKSIEKENPSLTYESLA